MQRLRVVVAALVAVVGPTASWQPARAQEPSPGGETTTSTPPAGVPAETAAPAPTGQLVLPKLGTLTIGGQLRVRGEFWRPATYDVLPTAPADPNLDASFVLLQTRLWLALDVNAHVAARVEFQDSRAWGTEGGVTGNLAGFDLFQGFVRFRAIADAPLELTLGRFAVPAFGSERVMSPLPWHNYGRAFDGGHLVWGSGAVKLHLLGALRTEASVAGTFPDNYADDDHWFTGLVAEWRPADTAFKADGYLFGRWSESRTTASEVGPADWWRQGTVGAWVSYAPKPLAFTAEAYGQFGRQGRDDIQAWAFAVTAAWGTVESVRVLAEYDFASGDTRPTDGKVNTFDPLFPFAHFHNGHLDAIQWSNVHVAKLATTVGLGALSAACKGRRGAGAAAPAGARTPERAGGALSGGGERSGPPPARWTAHVDLLGFWLASRRDAWYGVTGGAWRRDPARTVAGGGAIGSEVDVYFKGPLYGAVDVWLGYSHFFPGVYAHDTATPGGDDRDQDWVFVQLVTRF